MTDLDTDPDPATPLDWMVLAVSFIAIGVALFAIFAPQASAAEYEIVRYSKGANYSATSPNHSRLGEPYESRETCLNAIVRVRAERSGERLQCNEVATRPDDGPTAPIASVNGGFDQ